MDYTALESELLNDPESVGYQQYIDAGNHRKLADLLGQDDPTGKTTYTQLSSERARRLAAEHGAYGPIVNDAKDSGSSTQSLSASAWDTLRTPSADFALQLQAVRNMLQSLVNANVIPAAAQTAFLEASERSMRREEVVLSKGVQVTHTDVAKAIN